MRRRNDPYDEPAETEEERYDPDDSLFLTPTLPFGGWPPVYGNRGAEAEEAYRETDETDESWWDEGLIALLIIVGVVLFVFPEPATSAAGILLISVGVIAWLIDWLM